MARLYGHFSHSCFLNSMEIPLFSCFECLETRLEPGSSILEVFRKLRIMNWGTRIEFRGTVNLLLSGTIHHHRHLPKLYLTLRDVKWISNCHVKRLIEAHWCLVTEKSGRFRRMPSLGDTKGWTHRSPRLMLTSTGLWVYNRYWDSSSLNFNPLLPNIWIHILHTVL